jgi:hypothetical protein
MFEAMDGQLDRCRGAARGRIGSRWEGRLRLPSR